MRAPRAKSPMWVDPAEAERDESPHAEGSGLGRALKGLLNGVVNPNKPDPSNPVINGAASGRKSFWRNTVADILTQLPRAAENYEVVSSVLQSKLFDGGIVDDKTYQMEKVLKLVASLPNGSNLQSDMAESLINLLWDDIDHPPLSNVGDDYRYRQADGSNNNIMYPHLGRAGSSYVRTVTPKTLQPGILPDPGVIFDSLFARDDDVKPHPNKISSMLTYWATIIIHDLFCTDEKDRNRVKTSSYLDLAPLYGSSEEELAQIRTFRDGQLKPDTFCESRILGFPPGVAALLVCFNRFHNYVTVTLKEINEKGRFDSPADPNDEAGLRRLDNNLFQTARLITCGLYVNIILTDYVRTILNLNRSDTTWTLDPRDDFGNSYDQNGTPVGIGNQVSVEFNLVYRWHSMTSLKDAQWTSDVYNEIFPDQDISDLSEQDFAIGLRKWLRSQGSDPSKWTLDFGRYQRTKRGTFRDEDLVRILTDATEDIACAFGARQVPVAMRLIETMGIKQARSWNVATLNEYRRYFKLKPHEKFSDISSDPEVAHALKSLYAHPDYVELYPGLVAEDAKEPGDTSGLCPGYTVSRAILSDAVALVRGDRFYTADYTPANLTNWGYNSIQSDPDVAQGHCIYNLLMRAVPGWYRSNSVFAMFPFVIPTENRKILHSLDQDHKYSFARPELKAIPHTVSSWLAVVDILGDPTKYKVPYGAHIQDLIGSEYPYMLGHDGPSATTQRQAVKMAMYCPVNGMDHIRVFYEALTTQLIEIRSERLRGDWYQLDACRDVANPSHAIFAARLWHIPLKGHQDSTLGAEVDQLYKALAVSFAYVFLDADTASSFRLKNGAKLGTQKLTQLITVVVKAVELGRSLNVSRLFDMGKAGEMLSDYGTRLIRRLLDEGRPVDEVVSMIIPTAAGTVPLQAQQITAILDLYLSEPYSQHWPEIQRLAWSTKAEDFEKLKMYALEAARLRPAAVGALRQVASDVTLIDGDREIHAKKGDSCYLSLTKAGRDSAQIKNADQIDITRSKDVYVHHGWGAHSCLGREMVEIAMAAQLKVFAKLKNLRRAPGPQGRMKSAMPPPNPFSSDPLQNPGVTVYMQEDWSDWWPFPTNLKLHHDGFMLDQEEFLLKETGLPHRNTDLKASKLANGDSPRPSFKIRIDETIDEHPEGEVNGASM